MSAEVETMFYVSNEENERFTPWHGLGTSVEKAPTSAEAIKLAGLDWEVVQTDVLNGIDNSVIKGYKANVRSTDGKFLGMVGNRYQVVQNNEAFDFTDALLGEGVTYETAGSLFDGRRIWLLAKMPQTKILGDEVVPYLCFTNGHDGRNGIKAICTPIRVVCNNTLNFALDNAKRAWSTRHVGDLKTKFEEARHTLDLANNYIKELDKTSDMLANTTVSDEEVRNVLNNVFTVKDGASDRKKENKEALKDKFMVCMLAPDLAKFAGTAYQVAQAASDFACHTAPNRVTSNYREKNFDRILDGHIVMDKVFEQLLKKVRTGEKIKATTV